jgi:hypothetical protein
MAAFQASSLKVYFLLLGRARFNTPVANCEYETQCNFWEHQQLVASMEVHGT